MIERAGACILLLLHDGSSLLIIVLMLYVKTCFWACFELKYPFIISRWNDEVQYIFNGRNYNELFHTANSSLCFKSSANSARVSVGFFPLSTAIFFLQSLRNLYSMYLASAQHSSAT